MKAKRTRKIFKCFIYLIMIITILLEAMLSLGYIKVYKVVDNDYNHSVFTAIITLSTICFTIISIIISVAGNRVNEIKLSEII